MSYLVAMEFRVLRRIEWSGEIDEFRQHLDEVCRGLDDSSEILEWKLVGDLDSQSLELTLVVDAAHSDEAESVARRETGAVIRRAGAMHDGLLSLREESEARVHANAWYGLRTPRWQPRRVELEPL